MTSLNTLEDIQAAIVQKTVSASADHPWARLDIEFRSVSKMGELDVRATSPSGQQEWLSNLGIASMFMQLREAMYTEGKGTWYIARLAINKPANSVEFSFDYSTEPTWDLPPQAIAWIEDQQLYPRPVATLPKWHPSRQDRKI